MNLKGIRNRKLMLIIAIFLTTVMPMVFVRFNESSLILNILKLFAKLGSLCGTTLLIWQFLLGFRGFACKVLYDLIWVMKLHKSIGKYALISISMHPICITIYYVMKKDINPAVLQGGWPFLAYVLTGEIAFGLMILIVITSVFFRSRMNFSAWYACHLTSYILFVLLFVHSFPIGMTVKQTMLHNIWVGLAILVGVLILLRLLYRLEIFSSRYEVKTVDKVGPAVVKISAIPVSTKIKPKLGQFIYFRRGFWGTVRPFTVSHYNPQNGELSITVKATGKTTTALQNIHPGEKVYIDGPFGVFTQAAIQSDRPLVMIAGGIGITPFLRLFEELAYQPDRELHLFYGNKSTHEIVYRQQLDSIEHVNVIHVLSQQPDYNGETGYVTISLLKKYLPLQLDSYEFLICGPPIMIKKLEKALAEQNISNAQIHHELFSY